ncbi:tetratricopeptide repeat protein [Botrimarina hoheduenensis]|uniref:Cellulose synthase subunit BcsC n=1 Tax=Botrimarina hoheduenensis TaxID=2528000 RepID=A0A5C5VWJ2_9BACT|nr:tetratricopeptide repeat protein [Botrimarina hoheduenensis]TWT42477.1 cellulose synthase subunit BcsC [Botrimarina hoheduenensis]
MARHTYFCSLPTPVSAMGRALCAALPGGLLAVVVLATGCNTVQNQTLNAEGVALYRQGAYPQAAEKFQTAISKQPDAADGYYNLAASLHQTGVRLNRPADLQQAEVLYNQCLERDANHVECHRGLAVLLNETNRPDAAFRLMNNWAMASPSNPSPRIELARLLEESKQPEQATTQLVQALTVDPNNARALAALGRIRDQSGDYQQALQNYQRSLAANPSQPQLAARVATLTSAAGGQVSGLTAPAGQTRMVNQWQGAPARY